MVEYSNGSVTISINAAVRSSGSQRGYGGCSYGALLEGGQRPVQGFKELQASKDSIRQCCPSERISSGVPAQQRMSLHRQKDFDLENV